MTRSKILFAFAFAVLFFATDARAQNQTIEEQPSADENFKLNITDKKITETNYEAKTELSTGGDNRAQVSVNVGAAVRAEQITLTLRNVFGDVRFRGSLEKIINQINLLRQPEKNK